MNPIIKTENLVKRYGDLIALDHLNLEVYPGEIFGLLGPNGSGKTSAINTILSLLTYDKGSISLFGRPMQPDAYDIKRRIGLVMQEVAVFDELTVYRNIRYFCGLYERDKRKLDSLTEEAISFTGLDEFRNFYPKKLSGGPAHRPAEMRSNRSGSPATTSSRAPRPRMRAAIAGSTWSTGSRLNW